MTPIQPLEDFVRNYERVCNERGYLVVGWSPDQIQPAIGTEIKTFSVPDQFGFIRVIPFSQPFRILQHTTLADFQEQLRLFGDIGTPVMSYSNFIFYRAYTD
jgi:hypothetical protein